jgi:hypothetical protein
LVEKLLAEKLQAAESSGRQHEWLAPGYFSPLREQALRSLPAGRPQPSTSPGANKRLLDPDACCWFQMLLLTFSTIDCVSVPSSLDLPAWPFRRSGSCLGVGRPRYRQPRSIIAA